MISMKMLMWHTVLMNREVGNKMAHPIYGVEVQSLMDAADKEAIEVEADSFLNVHEEDFNEEQQSNIVEEVTDASFTSSLMSSTPRKDETWDRGEEADVSTEDGNKEDDLDGIKEDDERRQKRYAESQAEEGDDEIEEEEIGKKKRKKKKKKVRFS